MAPQKIPEGDDLVHCSRTRTNRIVPPESEGHLSVRTLFPELWNNPKQAKATQSVTHVLLLLQCHRVL